MNVFISYSWADKFLANRFRVRLDHLGYSVFLDQEKLRVGQELPSSLRKELEMANYLLVIWTKNAYKSKWVKWEVEYVSVDLNQKDKVIPILIDAVSENSCIQDLVGINFRDQYRFERFLSVLLDSVLDKAHNKSNNKNSNTFLGDNPRIKYILENPIEKELKRLNGLLSLTKNSEDYEIKSKEMQTYWDNWSNDDINILGLPDITDPEYHSLDYSLWHKSVELVSNQDSLNELDKKVFPSLFGRILTKYGAGFEAIEVLIGKWPELSAKVFYDVINMDFITRERLEVLIELFLEINALCQNHLEKEYIIPYQLFGLIASRNWRTLSDKSINNLFGLIEIYVDKPYPGTPIDLISHFCNDKESVNRSFKIIQRWVTRGMLDGINPSSGSDSPKFCFFFIRRLHENYKDETNLLLNTVCERIRTILRYRDEKKVYPFILNWIAAASEILPLVYRGSIGYAIDEGMYSSEYESLKNSIAIRPLLGSIRSDFLNNLRIDESKFRKINEILTENGIPECVI